uniref:Uncharacterized protein n=1 Tax=Anguilla anguilla TaxID=7936 RepID=A0A0E9QE95_ANGAN
MHCLLPVVTVIGGGEEGGQATWGFPGSCLRSVILVHRGHVVELS